MNTLKIKTKLAIGAYGQIVIIGLLLVFIITTSKNLNRIVHHRNETIESVNILRNLSKLATDFIYEEITVNDLQDQFLKTEKYINNSIYANYYERLKSSLNNVQKLRIQNESIENQIKNLTETSLAQSNGYITNISKELIGTVSRKNVSIIERQVIDGANKGTNNTYKIKVLFEKVKREISYKKDLYSFLDQSIEQAKFDETKLRNTKFSSMPAEGIKANEQIKDLVIQYVQNIEHINNINNELIASTDLH